MIVNAQTLLKLSPIKDMEPSKKTLHGVSYGLSEAGYDIRIAQDVLFLGDGKSCFVDQKEQFNNRFALASAMEEFTMPDSLVAIVHDKSTWARRGLSVFNTVIEPGFFGGLTLELVFHGNSRLFIPKGSGIAQVLFHKITNKARYAGKYNGQSMNPEPARDG